MDPKRVEELKKKAVLFKKIWDQYEVARDVYLNGLQTETLSIALEDVCQIGKSYALDFKNMPAGSASRFQFLAKYLSDINDWFIQQSGALQ